MEIQVKYISKMIEPHAGLQHPKKRIHTGSSSQN